jgi:hypothetical protein
LEIILLKNTELSAKNCVQHPTIMVCATEAGSAANLVEILPGLFPISDVTLFSESGGRRIFNENDFQVIDSSTIKSVETADQIIEGIRPKVVICGRGIDMQSADRFLVAAARNQGIPSLVIIDEWYDYSRNFADDHGNLVFCPDVICCPDWQAKNEAISEGLASDRLYVTGSPAYAAVVDKVATFTQQAPPLPVFLQGSYLRPVILFISEDTAVEKSVQNGDDLSWKKSPRVTDSESKIREGLIRALHRVGEKCTVVERPHPSRRADFRLSVSELENVSWRISSQDTLATVIWHCDLVIGIRSAALLTASLMAKPTLSYQPELRGENQCTAVRKGITQAATNSTDLADWLVAHWSAKANSEVIQPEFSRKDASTRVLSLIQSLLDRA